MGKYKERFKGAKSKKLSFMTVDLRSLQSVGWQCFSHMDVSYPYTWNSCKFRVKLVLSRPLLIFFPCLFLIFYLSKSFIYSWAAFRKLHHLKIGFLISNFVFTVAANTMSKKFGKQKISRKLTRLNYKLKIVL